MMSIAPQANLIKCGSANLPIKAPIREASIVTVHLGFESTSGLGCRRRSRAKR
ncbi:MAG TPA: hypothetical protein VGZ22_05165 [Isosphaeraceae bacterium]|nr:hypothetical protein [Isosphaeraceae bacterium]